jgi:hypothetical protein
VDRQFTDEEDKFLLLSRGYRKGQIECEIIAAQDLALQTKYHATKILQTKNESKFRHCKQFDKTV